MKLVKREGKGGPRVRAGAHSNKALQKDPAWRKEVKGSLDDFSEPERPKTQEGGIKERASFRKNSKARTQIKVDITEIRGYKQAPTSARCLR